MSYFRLLLFVFSFITMLTCAQDGLWFWAAFNALGSFGLGIAFCFPREPYGS
jgi:hypothetical protein